MKTRTYIFIFIAVVLILCAAIIPSSIAISHAAANFNQTHFDLYKNTKFHPCTSTPTKPLAPATIPSKQGWLFANSTEGLSSSEFCNYFWNYTVIPTIPYASAFGPSYINIMVNIISLFITMISLENAQVLDDKEDRIRDVRDTEATELTVRDGLGTDEDRQLHVQEDTGLDISRTTDVEHGLLSDSESREHHDASGNIRLSRIHNHRLDEALAIGQYSGPLRSIVARMARESHRTKRWVSRVWYRTVSLTRQTKVLLSRFITWMCPSMGWLFWPTLVYNTATTCMWFYTLSRIRRDPFSNSFSSTLSWLTPMLYGVTLQDTPARSIEGISIFPSVFGVAFYISTWVMMTSVNIGTNYALTPTFKPSGVANCTADMFTAASPSIFTDQNLISTSDFLKGGFLMSTLSLLFFGVAWSSKSQARRDGALAGVLVVTLFQSAFFGPAILSGTGSPIAWNDQCSVVHIMMDNKEGYWDVESQLKWRLAKAWLNS